MSKNIKGTRKTNNFRLLQNTWFCLDVYQSVWMKTTDLEFSPIVNRRNMYLAYNLETF